MLKPEEIIERVLADRKVCRIVSDAGITIAPEPESPPNRPGLKWIPHQLDAGGPITWIESEYDPSMPGTTETPILYETGIEVCPNYFYIFEGVKKVWTGERGTAPAWNDERFAEV